MLHSDLVRLYPELHHMAEDGSWPSIRRHGLLSSRALVTAWGVPTRASDALVRQIRRDSTTIEHPDYGAAVIRDQKPIDEASLASALIDMTVPEWLEHLNSRVFFFLQRERLEGLLTARSYRGRPHLVITVDTASLLRAHSLRVELSKINSGFAKPHSKAARGHNTFRAIEQFRHPVRKSRRLTPPWDVAELCVTDGVVDIESHVIRVERMLGIEVIERIV